MNQPPGGAESDKRGLRKEILGTRKRLHQDDVHRTSSVLVSRARELPELSEARTVAAYVSVGGEPGTLPLLDDLHARGVRVLLPVLLDDNDLDWGRYEGPESLAAVRHAGRMTLLEPRGPRLGPDAVLTADAVLLPGLAVDHRGMRLGRGGGSYDRVLARLERSDADPALVVMLYDAEVLARVPSEAHDRPVHAVVTPSGIRRFPGGGKARRDT
ncbi:5-formyltetrahydrofolate cyclo-ligase [Streptomyces uncialis]|uniref:5-formyltetrahydrofolate cyclo-ligase n=1 Tax=Streptomyces uncialis TaxID=1048205 RepID=UPI00386F9218|nr:5-formyltetrahydrofolate cyclo-ligase [Streptomyces uncialis]